MSGQEKIITIRKVLRTARLPKVDSTGNVTFYVAAVDTNSNYVRSGWVIDDHRAFMNCPINNNLILKSNYEIAFNCNDGVEFKPGGVMLSTKLLDGYKLVPYGE